MKDTRAYVTEYLDEKKKNDPNFCVVDVGGAGNPWYPRSNYIVDMNPTEGRDIICGDINNSSTWETIRSINPDFIICTHVLEDIRNPFYVMDEIQRSSPAGYISFPTKHQELTRQESIFYVGYCHHRWIYTLAGEQLRVLSKMPITKYWSSAFYLFRKICSFKMLRKRLTIRGLFWPAVGDIPWLNKKKGHEQRELGFIWEKEFVYSIVNNDYAGYNFEALADLYTLQLRDGL
jgi:hypothetical protein